MNVRAIVKPAAPFVARYSGLGKALALRYGGAGAVFMLHSIVGDGADHIDAPIRCPASALERALLWIRDNGVRIVGLDEAVDRLESRAKDKFCVLSFDDGYADNLTRALPILERFEAPFTVYVTTGMVTGEIDAWWFGLAKLIAGRDRIDLPQLGCRFNCADLSSKQQTYVAVATLVDSNNQALAAVRSAIAASGIDCHALARAEGLSIGQLRQLAASPLVTIGAHGVRHINLARASAAEVEQEMTASRRWLEEAIDREVAHFAYPFGGAKACGPREAGLAEACGFRTAVTTRHGTLFPEHLDHRYALPREPIFGDDTPISWRCRIDGTYRAYHSKLGDPVARM